MRKFKNIILISIFLITLYIVHYITAPSPNNFYISNPKLFTVHYINVDQGDCSLIQVNNKNLLIDAGPSSYDEYLIKYLCSLKIKTLDYVIATHPHEDHIGGMNKIINRFNIINFYAPKVYTNTKTFENMIDSLKSKNLKINILDDNSYINLGENTYVSISPAFEKSYDNLNNYSPIIKIQYGTTSFLFTGDAEKYIEDKIVHSNMNIKSDVLKAGHHGSSTSTSSLFLKKVNPKIAVISVGRNNEFNHPDKKVIQRLNENNVKIYQTSIDGNIVLTSNGTKITKIK